VSNHRAVHHFKGKLARWNGFRDMGTDNKSDSRAWGLSPVQTYSPGSRLPGQRPSLVLCSYGLLHSRNMFVDKTIQGERSSALDDDHQGQRDRQQMVLDPVSFLGSEPV